jgi:hypothetical protein
MERRYMVGFYAAVIMALMLAVLWVVTSDHAAVTLSAQ